MFGLGGVVGGGVVGGGVVGGGLGGGVTDPRLLDDKQSTLSKYWTMDR